ncbi:CCA tRNA nucleotidyltransferase [Methanosphaera sp. WGK6]|uniref:CCA tRNA nucleotidyltransferase n=1 Tax=Methanosphaera sp. WGK6 TaxID=1561964 RepID=UPI00084CAC89|nr:CCA tRNA nucleotidyltransferase [Methanosphaera sp. WGK6]
MQGDIIYNQILNSIKPSEEERKVLLSFSDKLRNIILDYAKEKNVTIDCRLVGSMAKKTSLIDKADFDIFMTFPLDYSEEELKEYGLEFGQYCINVVGGESEKRYASHPYITGLIDGFEVDFVPCYNIKDANELKSAVDRTILHTDYVQSHLTDEEADQVLLLKKFMSSINTYGANYKVSGFSGYLCELLILEYHTFENVITNAANNWHNKFEIDLEEYGTCSNYKDPLIVIDPVDKNRNVAAALSMQKFSEFIVASRNYLKNPSEDYFEDKHVKTSVDEIIHEFNKRQTKCYVLSFNVPKLPTDVIYPQVNKTMKSLEKVSKMYDFRLLEKGYYISSDNVAHILLEYEVDKLSNVKIHHGPLVQDANNSINFKNKYPNAYIHNNKWISLTNRKYITVQDMITNIFKKENMSILKLGKNIKEEILNKYFFEEVTEYIKSENTEDLSNIYMHLYPNFKLER